MKYVDMTAEQRAKAEAAWGGRLPVDATVDFGAASYINIGTTLGTRHATDADFIEAREQVPPPPTCQKCGKVKMPLFENTCRGCMTPGQAVRFGYHLESQFTSICQ